MNSYDPDHALAIILQAKFNEESKKKRVKEKENLPVSVSLNAAKSCLVDPEWEVTDPCPDIHGLFLAFNDRFFWGHLVGVEVKWSPQMTSCAGICVYEGRGRLCSVRLSAPLLKLRPRSDLVETLLHEMIHAYLFVTHNNRDRDGHGPEFHKHMNRINQEAGTNITVYHSFHAEVKLYQQHWWRCDGPCQKRPPFFGMVKRARNRAPGPNDFWWGNHQAECGGRFIKIREPEGYGLKGKAKESKDVKEVSSEEFFYNNVVPFFDSPTTPKPSFDEAVEQFFGVKEEERFFKKEEDMFEQMKENEKFFFKDQDKQEKLSGVNDSLTLTQRSRLCNCHDVYCGCCYSVKLFGKEKFNGCMEMEYVSRDFAIFITISINGHIIITRVLSGRNPLPFCTSTPYIPLVSFCIRLYDIHHNPHGLSLCMRLEATSMRRILFSISFDCIKIDHQRISFYMPPNATTFGVVGFHLGDTDPYISYQDWTKLHIPLPEITAPTPTSPPQPTYRHHFLWLRW